MTDDEGFVEFTRAKNGFEAKLIVSILQEAGIPAHGEGDSLQDEFAMAQALMNTGGQVKVHVAAGRVEDAKKALADAREAGEDLEARFDELQKSEDDPQP